MQDAVIRDDVKVLSDSPADVTALHRFIAATKLSARPAWQQHSQILAQSVKVMETGGDLVGLEVCGYVKSKAMTADQLIHIPSYGTYQVMSSPHDSSLKSLILPPSDLAASQARTDKPLAVVSLSGQGNREVQRPPERQGAPPRDEDGGCG